jgi:hypothetical protein
MCLLLRSLRMKQQQQQQQQWWWWYKECWVSFG